MDAENSALLSEINDILNCNISQYKQDAMPIILYHIREKDAGQEIDLFLFEHHWVHQRETVETPKLLGLNLQYTVLYFGQKLSIQMWRCVWLSHQSHFNCSYEMFCDDQHASKNSPMVFYMYTTVQMFVVSKILMFY